MLKICINIGGTFTKTGLFKKNEIIQKKTFKTFPNNKKSKTEFLIQLNNIINFYIKKNENIKSINLVIPGIFKTKKKEVLKHSKNLNIKNFNIKKYLIKKYKTKIIIENDANSFVLGEYKFGYGRNYNNVVGITLGTGIGVGIIINKKLYIGKLNAGEISYLKYKDSILEDYVGKLGIINIAKKYNIKIKEPIEISSIKYKKIWEEYSLELFRVIEIITLLLDPDIIIFGGGIAKSNIYFKKFLLDKMKLKKDLNYPKIKFSNSNKTLKTIALVD